MKCYRKLCECQQRYHTVSWVIFFVNGTPTEGRERAYEGTGNRAESRSISSTRWSLLSAPMGTDTKIISSSSAVYENNIVKHDLVRLALNVIVVNLSRCFRYRNVYLCPVHRGCTCPASRCEPQRTTKGALILQTR